jgi:recombination protein RecR
METHIEKLATLFARFPGIGERQAKRFVYFLLRQDNGYIDALAREIAELRSKVSQCTECFVFFEAVNGQALCSVCSKRDLDQGVMMVVEKDADYEVIKRTRVFGGRVFVLGGLAPAILKDVDAYIRIRELRSAVERRTGKGGLQEIILALSLTTLGIQTDEYIRRVFADLVDAGTLRITSLGRGLSTGTEIEYSDKETIVHALSGRK